MESHDISGAVADLSELVISPNIGATVISTAALAKLKPEHRTIVIETGKVAAKALTERIRAEDAQALERLKKRMTVVDPTPAEREAWNKIFKVTQEKLVKGTFKPELVKKFQDLAAK